MKVLVIADTQEPFSHQDYFSFIKALAKKYKPDEVVHVGDEIDHHALGNWEHDPDGLSAGDELCFAIACLKPYYKRFPKMKVCVSNHTSRPFRKAFSAGIPTAYLKTYGEFLQAPKGWKWADHWIIDKVRYEHGMGLSGAGAQIQATKGNMMSTVFGHIHAHAGIHYVANEDFLLFGMNVGSGIDRNKYAFKYGKEFKNKPILGAGLVVDGIPHYFPMVLTKKGRWNGKI
jgi:hypothetical protein